MEKVSGKPFEPNTSKNIRAAAQDDSGSLPQPESMTKFWILGEPETAEAERRRAKWNTDDGLRYESIRCPIEPDKHRRAGARISPLSIILPNLEPREFVWTPFECLVQESVVRFFGDAGFTGYDMIPAKAKFASSSRQPPKFWELIAKGTAGTISVESSYKVLENCPGCGLPVYDTRILDPTRVVDEAKWDGTDFFHVEPASGWIFVTDPVVKSLRGTKFKCWAAYTPLEWRESFDIAFPGHPKPTSTEGH